MGNTVLLRLTVTFILCWTLFSCKDDSPIIDSPPVPDQSFVEEFDTIQSAYNRGWRFINTSENTGPSKWTQGSISGTLTAYSSKGTSAGFISSDYQSTAADAAIISNWAVSPPVMIQNGDKIVFYTITSLYDIGGDSTDFANRLQVKVNVHNDELNVGDKEDPGLFEKTILDINSTYEEYHSNPSLYSPTAYPARWARFEAVIYGINKPIKGRFAFRYFVEDGGSNGRGSEIGIDSVSYISKHE
jgi:hypothetical protein